MTTITRPRPPGGRRSRPRPTIALPDAVDSSITPPADSSAPFVSSPAAPSVGVTISLPPPAPATSSPSSSPSIDRNSTQTIEDILLSDSPPTTRPAFTVRKRPRPPRSTPATTRSPDISSASASSSADSAASASASASASAIAAREAHKRALLAPSSASDRRRIESEQRARARMKVPLLDPSSSAAAAGGSLNPKVKNPKVNPTKVNVKVNATRGGGTRAGEKLVIPSIERLRNPHRRSAAVGKAVSVSGAGSSGSSGSSGSNVSSSGGGSGTRKESTSSSSSREVEVVVGGLTDIERENRLLKKQVRWLEKRIQRKEDVSAELEADLVAIKMDFESVEREIRELDRGYSAVVRESLSAAASASGKKDPKSRSTSAGTGAGSVPTLRKRKTFRWMELRRGFLRFREPDGSAAAGYGGEEDSLEEESFLEEDLPDQEEEGELPFEAGSKDQISFNSPLYEDRRCDLVSPATIADVALNGAAKTRFSIRCPNATDVVVVIDDDFMDRWQYLRPDPKAPLPDTFSEDVVLTDENSFLDIMVKWDPMDKFQWVVSIALED